MLIVALVACVAGLAITGAFRRAWRLMDPVRLGEITDGRRSTREQQEATLTAQLLAGGIAREHYRASMALLAAPEGDLPGMVADPEQLTDG